VRVDRKGNPDLVPIRVPHPFLAVVGNIPPGMLGEFREFRGREDGFIDRILFAYPDRRPRPYWSEVGIPEDAQEVGTEVVGRLRARPMASKDGRPCPEVVRFMPGAKAAWIAWYNAHIDEVNDPGHDAGESAVEGKLCDFAGRLALILHLLWL